VKQKAGSRVRQSDSASSEPLQWLVQVPIVVLFAFMPFVFSLGGLDTFRLPKGVFAGITSLVIVMVTVLRGRWDVFKFPLLSWEALLVGGTGFVGLHTIISTDPAVSWNAFLDFLPLVALFFCLREPLSQRFQERLWLLVSGALGINAALLMVQYYGKATFMLAEDGSIVAGRRNPSGLIGEVNSGGFLFGLAVVISAYFLVTKSGRGVRILAAVLLLLNALGLAYSRTLTAVVGLGTAFLIWLFFHHWWYFRKGLGITRNLVIFWAILVFGIAGAASLGVYSGVAPRLAGVVSDALQGNLAVATAGRAPVLRMTLRMIRQSPFVGSGLDTFGQEFFRFRVETEAGQKAQLLSQPGSFREVHNDYLQVWQELGVLGLLIMLGLFAIPLVSGVRSVLKTADAGLQYWQGILMIALVYAAVNCLAFFPLRIAVTSAYVVLVLACLRAFQMPIEVDPKRRKYQSSMGWPAWTGIGVIGLVCLLMGVRDFRLLEANVNAGFAARLLEGAASGRIRAAQQRLLADQAMTRLEKVESQVEELPEILTLEGAAYMAMGRYQDAANAYQKVIRFIPSPESYTNLAAAYMALGQNEQAREAVAVALKYDAGYDKAIQARKRLDQRSQP